MSGLARGEVADKHGFIRDMDAALRELRAAMLRNPQHASDYLPTCVLLESAIGRLIAKRIDH